MNYDEQIIKSSPSYLEDYTYCTNCGVVIGEDEEVCEECAKKLYK